MGYSNYKKIKTVTQRFGLDAQTKMLFESVMPIAPSTWLLETLKKAKIAPLTNEKTKSERVISPILLEIAEYYQDQITLFSGEELDIDAQSDLSGACDFFFVLQPHKPYIESPIISLVESKNEDMEYGRAQCAAQLYGTKLFNEAEGKPMPFLYGCATDGVEWQFIRFQNDVFYIDTNIYTDLKEILGVWHIVIQQFLVSNA
ncbi:MAG: hypothetical protein MUE30_00175 [Spirosomaceae bacterium]|jgi:hypothetical protein|nr:hypothetical protein [Spirosomataceae bacterium]